MKEISYDKSAYKTTNKIRHKVKCIDLFNNVDLHAYIIRERKFNKTTNCILSHEKEKKKLVTVHIFPLEKKK